MRGAVKGRRGSLLFPALAAVVFAIGCGSSGVTSVTAPTASHCDPSLSGASSSFGAAGGTGTLAVGVARECAWSAASSAGWLIITAGASGQGDGTVAFRVSENGDPATRSAAITVGDQHADIDQAAAACAYALSTPAGDLSPAGDRVVIDVRTQSGCPWQAHADADWVTLQPDSGTGTGTIAVTAAANSGGARTVNVTVATERATLTQSAPLPADGGGGGGSGGGGGGGGAGQTIDLSGKIDKLKGTCPSVQFSLSGYLVKTTAATEYAGRSTCKDMKNGKTATLTGTLADPKTVTATKIEVKP